MEDTSKPNEENSEEKEKEDPNIAKFRRLSSIRRGAVSAQSYTNEEMKNYVKKVIPKNEKTRKALRKVLKKNVLFKHISAKELEDVYDAMFPVEFLPGDDIIKQGDKGDNFYIIDKGEVEIFVNKKLVATRKSPAFFGELALIYNTPRTADVKAKTEVKLWAIDRDTYRYILMSGTVQKRKLYCGFLSRIPLLKSLDEYEIISVADALDEVYFKAKEEIIRQGDEGDFFYIIVEGNCSVFIRFDAENLSAPYRKVATLGPPAYFGELAILFDKPRAATIIADTEMKCVRLDRGKFERLLGNAHDVMRRNMEAYQK